MTKPMSKMLMYVSIFFALVFGWYGVKKVIFMWYLSQYQPPAVTVSETKAAAKTWQSYLNAVGTLTAVNGVELSAEVPGIIQEIRFDSGQFVKKGDVIVILRSEVEQAALKNNQAKLELAKINYERDKTLFARKVTSQAALDTSYAQLLQAQAGVESVQAQIAQKTITAPFDGRIGIRQVNLGQYISPGATLVTLQSLNPLHVIFHLPEQYLESLSTGQDVDVMVNIGEGKQVKGKVDAINAKVDAATRNIEVEATLPNDNLTLYPGMYGQVKIWLGDKKNAVVVPQTALSYSLSGDYVFVVKTEGDKKHPQLHVYRQNVQVGERRGDSVSIKQGLKPGDSIITSGQLKLQNGATVLIDNNVEL